MYNNQGKSLMFMIADELAEEEPPAAPPPPTLPKTTSPIGKDNVFVTDQPDLKDSIPGDAATAEAGGTRTPAAASEVESQADNTTLSSIPSTMKRNPSLSTYTSITTTDNKHPSAVYSTVEKETFGSKLEYILVLISYAIGFGTMWRFPYLMQEYGGIVFIIPYTVMLLLVGFPVFLLELAIGQRLRKSSFKAWTEVSPYLAGLGVACALSCVVIGFYENTLIAWCCDYFINIFRETLPWTTCELAVTDWGNETKKRKEQCKIAGASSYFWYSEILDTSLGIEDPGNLNWTMFGCLIFSWILIWLILVKGMVVAGKVAYMTSLLPYLVLIIFLVNGLFFTEGMEMGFSVVFTPDWTKLYQVKVWFIAGTQILFTQGIAVGILVSYAALQPVNNNCVKDAFTIPLVDYFTSLFAAVVNCPILGSKGLDAFKICSTSINSSEVMLRNATHVILKNKTVYCDLREKVKNSAGGTGLIFITFTQAVKSMKCPQLWAFFFFFMLLTVGIGSSFPQIEGFILCLQDMNIKWLRKVAKWKITTVTCLILMGCSLIFAWGWGNYMLTFLDQFTANWSLLVISFCECIGVAWIYGLRRFARDLYLMTGYSPKSFLMLFFLTCIKFIAPFLMFLLFVFSLAEYGFNEESLSYYVWKSGTGKSDSVKWPMHVLIIGFVLTIVIVGFILVYAVLAHFNIHPMELEGPAPFPERKLKHERNLTTGEYENLPQSMFERILYWKFKKRHFKALAKFQHKAHDDTGQLAGETVTNTSEGGANLQPILATSVSEYGAIK